MLARNHRGAYPVTRRIGYPLWPSDMLSEFFQDPWFGGSRSGSPRADVREKDDEFIIEMEMPGLDKQGVEISIEDDILTVAAKREDCADETDEDGRYIRRERCAGAFQRSFSLEGVRSEGITADMKDGVLTVFCPKDQPARPKPRKVEIA